MAKNGRRLLPTLPRMGQTVSTQSLVVVMLPGAIEVGQAIPGYCLNSSCLRNVEGVSCEAPSVSERLVSSKPELDDAKPLT